MANIPIYDGNPTWDSSSVPFGFYTGSSDFQIDAVKVAKFCAQRLGYPIMDVELEGKQMYACFEEAVTEYSSIVKSINSGPMPIILNE